MGTTDDLRAIRDMVHNIDVGLAEVMAWLDGVIERTDAPTDRRDVLAEITRDETADGPRADGFPANDTTVVRDDGAGKGSTAAKTGHESDAQPAEAPGEGRSEIGPQKGVQSLGDDLRELAADNGSWGVEGLAGKMRYLADRADALKRLADTETRLVDSTQAALVKVRAERDRLAAEVESLQRAAQVTTTSWRKHVERADKAEAAVARVRALLDRPLIPSALLRDALDGVDADGEA